MTNLIEIHEKKNVKEERHFQNYNFNNFINCDLLNIYV